MGFRLPQGDPGDPMWEYLWAKGRHEHAFLWLVGGLVVGTFLSLIFHAGSGAVDPKLAATGMVMLGFGLPLISFRGWARTRPVSGTVVAMVAMGLASWVTSWKPLVALISVGFACAGALKAYRVQGDRDYRPHMMQAAIEKARTEFGRPETRQEG